LLIMTYVWKFDHVPSNDLLKALSTHASFFLILSSLDRYVRARPLAQVTLNKNKPHPPYIYSPLQQLALTSAKPEQQRLSGSSMTARAKVSLIEPRGVMFW
jgi:hypothetical protein